MAISQRSRQAALSITKINSQMNIQNIFQLVFYIRRMNNENIQIHNSRLSRLRYGYNIMTHNYILLIFNHLFDAQSMVLKLIHFVNRYYSFLSKKRTNAFESTTSQNRSKTSITKTLIVSQYTSSKGSGSSR